jgi:hypothetical protein
MFVNKGQIENLIFFNIVQLYGKMKLLCKLKKIKT